jgi:hypothetical protein
MSSQSGDSELMFELLNAKILAERFLRFELTKQVPFSTYI